MTYQEVVRTVEVPQIVYKDVPVPNPVIQTVERIIEVPQVQVIERVVEVPELQYQDYLRHGPSVFGAAGAARLPCTAPLPHNGVPYRGAPPRPPFW